MDEECNVIFDSNQLIEIPEQEKSESETFSTSFHTFVDSNELMVFTEFHTHSQHSTLQENSLESILDTPICPELSPLIQEIQTYDPSAVL